VIENIRMLLYKTWGCCWIKHGDVVEQNMGMFLFYVLLINRDDKMNCSIRLLKIIHLQYINKVYKDASFLARHLLL